MATFYDLPLPDKKAFLRSAALRDVICHAIKHAGRPISFSHFMQLALYHAQYGYYCQPDFNLGAEGDFITAPVLTPLFAQCLAKQCQDAFNKLIVPNILELGAGTGVLAYDLIQELKRLDAPPKHYYIYEVSQALRNIQYQYIMKQNPDLLKQITWLDQLPKDFYGIIIANEVLDAIPAESFVITDHHIYERCVDWDGQTCSWSQRISENKEFNQEVQNLKQICNLRSGYQSEINLEMATFVKTVLHNLAEGMVLFIDYGYGQAEYYHPSRDQGTLKAFYKHHHLDTPFVWPGLVDLTTHVDFTRVIASACTVPDIDLLGFTTQAAFLMDCQLFELAQIKENELTVKQQLKMYDAIKTLTLPTEMGERIKVMGIGKNFKLTLRGSQLQDRRRDL